MGCCFSKTEALSNIDPTFIDIPLLNKPKQTTTSEPQSFTYFTIDNYTNDQPPKNRRPSYEGDIIEHSTLSVLAAPDIEVSRQQRFNECFSHIEANTFQNIPIMSVQSHLSVPQLDAQQMTPHDYEDYSRFIDQVISTLCTPLANMEIISDRKLVITLDEDI